MNRFSHNSLHRLRSKAFRVFLAAAFFAPGVHELFLDHGECSVAAARAAGGLAFEASCNDGSPCREPGHHHHHHHRHESCAVCLWGPVVGLEPIPTVAPDLAELVARGITPAQAEAHEASRPFDHPARAPPSLS